jgi:hypothetical protein
MKRNRMKPIYIIVAILALISSVAGIYLSIHTDTITASYILDVVTIIMILILIFIKNGKAKISVNHDNYMDWITDGSVVNNTKLIVNISSLEDLVKLAVDLDKRVIHDAKQGKYFVIAEDVSYIHELGLTNPILNNKQQLGKLLIGRGIIQQEQLETSLFYQRRINCRLGEALIALGFIDEAILYSTLAAQQNIAYYELDTKKDFDDTSWLTKMNINKARALQALPLGYRSDGKFVVACGDTAKAGMALTLQEILGIEIYVIAACPSHIYQILEKIENRERPKRKYSELFRDYKVDAYDRITQNEWIQFTNMYYKGKIDMTIFLKATGIVDPVLLAQVPANETIINWLTSKNLISGQVVNFIKTLDKMTNELDGNSRKTKVIPDLLDLLEEAFYITSETADWVYIESDELDQPIDQILVDNYMVSNETIDYAVLILESLNSILNKPKIF